jgi:hypothetical protein
MLRTLLIACLALPTLALAADHDHDEHEHGYEQHHAHVHGTAELLIAAEGQLLELEFISPAMNIVGFEHPPSTAEQRHAVQQAIALLQQPGRLFVLPAAAGCKLQEAEVETGLTGESHEHEHERAAHEHEHEAEEGHAEFHAHYHFRCSRPDALDGMDVTLFAHFPDTQHIRAQTLSSHGQHKAELDPQHHQLSF